MAIDLGNMNEVEAWKGGTMLPLGFHTVVISDAEEGTNKDDTHPVIELTFSNDGGSIRDWLHIVDGAEGKVAMLLDAVKIPRTENQSLSAEDLKGKSLVIFITEQADATGKRNDDGSPIMRRRVSAYQPTTGGSDVPGDTRDFGNSAVTDDDKIPF